MTDAPNVPMPNVDPAFERRRDIRAIHGVATLYGRLWQRVETLRACTVPKRGPALIAANHTAGLDPIAIQATCRRPIVWVMTREYYDKPTLRWLFQWTQMIPIDREGNDSRAWRTALRHLKAGHVVGVFPEGRIEKTRDLLPFQPGVCLLAARGGADVYPVYLDGRQRNKSMVRVYLEPQSPSVAWGEPLRVAGRNDRNGLAALAQQLQERVESLHDRYPSTHRPGQSLLRPSAG